MQPLAIRLRAARKRRVAESEMEVHAALTAAEQEADRMGKTALVDFEAARQWPLAHRDATLRAHTVTISADGSRVVALDGNQAWVYSLRLPPDPEARGPELFAASAARGD